MAFSNIVKTPTVLEQLLEEINFQRTKEMRQLMKDGMGVSDAVSWRCLFPKFLQILDL